MARPIKTGLDYFPMDVSFDDNMELFEAEEGLDGLGIILKIWQKIYKQGYYIEWNEDNVLLFSKKINSEIKRVNSVINTGFKRCLFDKNMYDKYKILTSRGIQKRFFTALKTMKRKNISIIKEYRLINGEYDEVFTEKISINSEETQNKLDLSPEESTQKKRKETKLKENKREQKNIYDDVADSIYNYYCSKLKAGNKQQSLNNIEYWLKEYSKEQLMIAIDNYSLEKVDAEAKYIKKCSNFFGVQKESRAFFKDYLIKKQRSVSEILGCEVNL